MPKAASKKATTPKTPRKKAVAGKGRATKGATRAPNRAKTVAVSTEKEAWSSARDEQHRLKREAILRVASRLINRKGDAGTSLADIADELDLRNASLYYYFKSKSDLVFACFQRAQRIDMESLDLAEADASSGLDAIERYVIVMGRRIREEGELPMLMGIRALEPEQMRTIFEARLAKMKRFERLIERGIEDGSIRPCDVPLATSMLAGALQFVPGHYTTVDPQTRPRLDRELTTTIRRMLGAQPA